MPSAVPPMLFLQAQASVPLFNLHGVQLNKEDSMVPQGKCFFIPFQEKLSCFHSAGIAGNYMITIACAT